MIATLLCLISFATPPVSATDLFEEDIVWDNFMERYYGNKTWNHGNTSNHGNTNNHGNVTKRDVLSYPTWTYKTMNNKAMGSLSYTIPYKNDIGDKRVEVYINLAMKEWNKQTCIKFVPRTTESNYINFVMGSTCNSYVGMKQGGQDLTLSESCSTDKGAIMHELGHILGLFHEQSRQDRDKYVHINFNNILNGTNKNFLKMTHDPVYVTNDNYDYLSIMHYGKTQSSKLPGNLTTVETLDATYQDLIGQRQILSHLDVEKVNFLYSCSCTIENVTTIYNRKYYGRCSLFGFGLITWKCIKTEQIPEVKKVKVCADVSMRVGGVNNSTK